MTGWIIAIFVLQFCSLAVQARTQKVVEVLVQLALSQK